MEHHKLVLPEHLNDHGSLFGGYLLKWVDELAYITVNIDFPKCKFVTIALDDVEFRHRMECGEILCFSVDRVRQGNTSVSYDVSVRGSRINADRERVLFGTRITFVSIDAQGRKAEIVE